MTTAYVTTRHRCDFCSRSYQSVTLHGLGGTVMIFFRRKRFVVRHSTGLRPWIVYDRHLGVTVADFVRREAAVNRAKVANSRREPSRMENPCEYP